MLLEEIWEQSKIVKIKSRWKFTKTWIRFHLSPRRLSLELPCSVDRFYFFVLACFSLLASTSDSSKSGCHDNSLILIFYIFFGLGWRGEKGSSPSPLQPTPSLLRRALAPLLQSILAHEKGNWVSKHTLIRTTAPQRSANALETLHGKGSFSRIGNQYVSNISRAPNLGAVQALNIQMFKVFNSICLRWIFAWLPFKSGYE